MVAEPATKKPSADDTGHHSQPNPVPSDLQLPTGIVTHSDAGRLATEAEAVDNFLNEAAIRQPGAPLQLPNASKMLDEVVAINKLNLLKKPDRQLLRQFLQAVQTAAPVVHISFSTDPSPIFQQRLITWMRQHMHPFVLLQIGLHPSIGAGCVVRTINKYHDFSLRTRFSEKRMLLISKLRGSDTPVEPTVPATATKEMAP